MTAKGFAQSCKQAVRDVGDALPGNTAFTHLIRVRFAGCAAGPSPLGEGKCATLWDVEPPSDKPHWQFGFGPTLLWKPHYPPNDTETLPIGSSA
jgi:hypothetical protein